MGMAYAYAITLEIELQIWFLKVLLLQMETRLIAKSEDQILPTLLKLNLSLQKEPPKLVR